MADDLAEICGIGSANAYQYITRPKQVYKLIFWTVSGQPSGLHIKRVRSHKMDWKNEGVILQLAELASKGLSSKDIATELSETYNEKVGDRSVRRVANSNGIELKQSNRNGYTPERHVETERHADGTINNSKPIEMSEAQAMDDEFVMKAHGFDPEKWQVVNIKNSFWEQNSREDGKTKLYSSKITVKPKENKASFNDIVASLNEEIKTIIVKKTNNGDKNLVIPLFDIHFGIMTGEKMDVLLQQMVSIIERGYDNISIIVGGDMLHSDFMSKTQTANNTQLDHVDTFKMLDDASKFMSQLIEISIANSNKTKVHAISGNHDVDSQFYFIWGLQQKFSQVDFDNNLNSRLAFQIGKIGILAAHGNVAQKRLPMLFANEYPEIWATSTYRMVASGHYHTEKLNDLDGVVVHQFGTPKSSDPYEVLNGYTMARKHLQLLEFSKERLLATYEIE